MFKQILVFCLASFFSLFAPTKSLANSGWEFSFQEFDQTGFFEYTLYHPYSSQVISKVSLPQDQWIQIIDVKYNFNNKKDFFRLRYGGTGTKFKGEGSDSDWIIKGSSTLTHYGVMDVFGKSKMVAVDFGTSLFEKETQKVNLVVGWVRQETTNELKNIVYHLVNGVDVGDLTQPDNGSCLDGEFSGLVLGINQDLTVRKNLIFTTELNLSFLRVKAYGHWANYTPAWNWENTGRVLGHGINLGLQYAFSSQIQAEIGYRYHHAQADGCREILNGSLLSQVVDLEIEQEGLYAALMVLF